MNAQAIQLEPYYPWLKCHGSIEGESSLRRFFAERLYPWLKCHGSIEGVAGGVGVALGQYAIHG